MGRCKQLLPLGDRSVLARSIETLLAAGVPEVVVVVGSGGDAGAVAAAARRYPVTVAVNAEAGSDMAASLRVGLAALGPRAVRVVVALGDTPLVVPATVAALLRRQAAEPQTAVIPTFAGRRGHPVVLPRGLLEEIRRHPTLRDLLRARPEAVRLLAVADEGVVLDLDTPEDHAALLARCLGGGR
jgi:CTP:molybdopterin cytidylyltransferase MocA